MLSIVKQLIDEREETTAMAKGDNRGDIPPHSSFNIDAMLSLGRLEQSSSTILQTQLDHAQAIRNIETRLQDLSAITQAQIRNDKDIQGMKDDLSKFKEQRGWVMGVTAAVSAIFATGVTILISFFRAGH